MINSGDYLGDWEKGVHPYGEPGPCPFCKAKQDYTALWYNGYGPPPSYAFCCGTCGAQGPASSGRERDDHFGARQDAIAQWNKSA